MDTNKSNENANSALTMRYGSLSILFLMSFLYSCNPQPETLPFYNTADFTAEWLTPADIKYNKIHTIDTFAMRNQVGNLITKDSLDGHIYVANFFFTICPSICPKMINNLHLLQDKYINNKNVKLVSFSVMPWVDSVARLKEYADNQRIKADKWHLLTGKKERIYILGRKSYFSEKKLGLQKDSSAFLHTEAMLLIDKKGRIRGIYNATEKEDIKRVTNDIELLFLE